MSQAATADTAAEVEEEGPLKTDNANTVKQFSHYLRRYRIWNNDEYEWLPYDPSKNPPPVKVEREDISNYFYVELRYKTVEAKPTTVLKSYSKTLLAFLRKNVGDNFFRSSPEYTLENFFPLLETFKTKLSVAEALLQRADDVTPEELATGTRTMGVSKSVPAGAQKGSLKEAIEHVQVLVEYLSEEFQATADRLALVTSYGHIEYDLLIYFLKVGMHVTTLDESYNLPLGFVIKSAYYENSVSPPYFVVKGYNYEWNGYDYVATKLHRIIEFFLGTKDFSELSAVPITPEAQALLQERGQLYTGFSGLHYQLYRDHRVIVDRIAFGNQSGYIRDPKQVIPALAEDKLHLLPPHVDGFDLQTKKWSSFLVDNLKPVVFDEEAWDHLVLDPNIKTLIRGLVEVTKNSNSTDTIIKDVISGKGGGLIAVLHGPPGTGKTLTAEAVAELLKRPLYMVGSSELPSSPSGLESSLKTVLKLATAWDAVLLIDEADVYLEQRSLHELARNALVSVALRLLEYHRGVLFLTTNRISSFDEAFLSRFSIAIKYAQLDQEGRYSVWRKFFEMAGLDVIETTTGNQSTDKFIESRDVRELSEKNLNGRTIKNIVRTAQALALSQQQPLAMEHVKVVLSAQEKFLDEFSSLDRLK